MSDNISVAAYMRVKYSVHRTMKTFCTVETKQCYTAAERGISQTQRKPYSAGGNWGAKAGCLRCKLTWDASCPPWSSCTGPCRPALERAWRPPPPGRTPWWPSPATAARGPVSKPQGLAPEAQKWSEKTPDTVIYNTGSHFVRGLNELLDGKSLHIIFGLLNWNRCSSGFQKVTNRKLKLQGKESYRN